MKDESTVQQEIQIEARHLDSHLTRNNNGACMDNTGRLIRYGLGHTSRKQNEVIKSSDLIGISQVVVTPEMVGQVLGVFTAVEVKKEAWKEDKKFDKREIAQNNYITWVKSLGGYAGFASHIDNLKIILRK